MKFGLKGGAAVLLAAVVLLVPGSAGACGCGEFKGPVVAHGTSPAGAPWRIKAVVPAPGPSNDWMATFGFSYGPDPQGDGTGAFTTLPLAARRHPFVTAIRGAVGPYAESDVSGIVQGRATRLLISFAAGEALTVEPQPAPLGLRARLHWLRGFRFYDLFYPEGAEAIRVEAFDRNGALLAVERLARRVSE